MPTFDIIIVSWNRLDYLKRTVASLMKSHAWSDAQRKIIVDNGSTDPEVCNFLLELMRMHGASLVIRSYNEGWGKAVNDALGLSRAEYLFVCNNDVENFKIDFHKEMLSAFETIPSIGIMGVWRHTSHGFVTGTIERKGENTNKEVRQGVQNSLFREMDNVPAVGWMMPKSAMEKVGMLPEHGACFTKGGNGEDTSYINRMKEKGYLTGVPATDMAWHIDGY